ncbi:MAG: S16 family serine protease [Candidatus Micrarchaeota archaeon]
MRFFLLLIGMLSLAFASCSGEVSHYIPAVVGDDGDLVQVTMSLAQGSGDTYVTITPKIGVSTQKSIEDAITYAKKASNSNENCNVYVNFPDKGGNLIEGPSGGASFSIMAYSLFKNIELREDTMITGTVDIFGNVGAVGGLYEKAKGASTIGAKYFITPEEDLYETFLLKDLKEQLNLTVLQAKSMDEIIGFVFYNETIEEVELSSKKREIPEVPYYNYSNMKEFEKVAERMIDLEEQLVANITANDNETAIIKSFFENEVLRQNAILEKGYLFTAANEAFLNYIDLWTIYATIEGNVDLDEKVDDISECLGDIERPTITDSNFQWVIGADLRQNWAQNKLENTEIDNLLEEEKYIAYNDIMYAQAWCEVAKGLLNSTNESGNKIDESEWKDIAERKLNEASNIQSLESNLEDRLEIAEEAFQDGEYGAAIYDAVFVIVQSEDVLDNVSLSIVNETRNSLWGNVYQSHAAYFYTQNQTSLAYRTARLAKELDLITTEMEGKMKIIEIEEEISQCYAPIVVGMAFLFIVIVIITKRRSHGTNGPRYRKTHRIK